MISCVKMLHVTIQSNIHPEMQHFWQRLVEYIGKTGPQLLSKPKALSFCFYYASCPPNKDLAFACPTESCLIGARSTVLTVTERRAERMPTAARELGTKFMSYTDSLIVMAYH